MDKILRAIPKPHVFAKFTYTTFKTNHGFECELNKYQMSLAKIFKSSLQRQVPLMYFIFKLQ